MKQPPQDKFVFALTPINPQGNPAALEAVKKAIEEACKEHHLTLVHQGEIAPDVIENQERAETIAKLAEPKMAPLRKLPTALPNAIEYQRKGRKQKKTTTKIETPQGTLEKTEEETIAPETTLTIHVGDLCRVARDFLKTPWEVGASLAIKIIQLGRDISNINKEPTARK